MKKPLQKTHKEIPLLLEKQQKQSTSAGKESATLVAAGSDASWCSRHGRLSGSSVLVQHRATIQSNSSSPSNARSGDLSVEVHAYICVRMLFQTAQKEQTTHQPMDAHQVHATRALAYYPGMTGTTHTDLETRGKPEANGQRHTTATGKMTRTGKPVHRAQASGC